MTSETPFDVTIQIKVAAVPENTETHLRAAVIEVLSRHEITPGAGLSIVITDDAEIQALNRQFRAVDAPTDVLSFPAEPDPIPVDVELDDEEDVEYLGDLVLSLPYIERHAAAEQHTVVDELVLAVVHGTLHVLGYDHDTAANQAEMWAVQAEILDTVGVAIVVPQFEFPDEDDTGR